MKLSRVVLASCALMLPAVVGCSTDKGQTTDTANPAGIGNVEMQIRLPSGVVINSINYDIEHSNGYNNEGAVNVENSPVVRFQVGKIPAAQGYTLGLSAVTSTNVQCTSTPVTFGVTAGGTTLAMATLRCGAGGTSTVESDAGNVRVSVDIIENPTVSCPEVDGLTALPLDVYVGSTISLAGYATGTGATFAWSSAPASANSFAAPTAATTTYLCSTAGEYTLTLSVQGAGCPAATETVPVTCVSTGTEPDAGPVEPDAGPDAGPVEPDAGPVEPDAGPVEPDAGPDAGPVEPDAGPVEPDAGPDAGPQPDLACANCRATNHILEGVNLAAGCFTQINTEFGASATDPLFLQQCLDVVTCAQANNCAYTAGSGPLGCYCGSNNLDQCAASGPANSPCLAQWQAGARGTSNAEVLGNISDLQYPAAWAYYVLDFDRQYCNNATAGNCTVPVDVQYQ